MPRISTLIVCGVSAANVLGAPITILNPGFELPAVATLNSFAPVSWVMRGTGGGVWNISDFPLGVFTEPAPEGNQVVYLAPASLPGGAQLEQQLGASLEDETVYTLTGMVGHPTGFGASAGTTYTASLLAGGVVVASVTGSGPDGTLGPFSLVFDSTGSKQLGGVLRIRLATNRPQTVFDVIALESLGPVECPEDINGDGVVDFADLNLLLGNFNTSGAPGTLAGDVDDDGDVDFADLNALLGVFNTEC